MEATRLSGFEVAQMSLQHGFKATVSCGWVTFCPTFNLDGHASSRVYCRRNPEGRSAILRMERIVRYTYAPPVHPSSRIRGSGHLEPSFVALSDNKVMYSEEALATCRPHHLPSLARKDRLCYTKPQVEIHL